MPSVEKEREQQKKTATVLVAAAAAVLLLLLWPRPGGAAPGQAEGRVLEIVYEEG